MALERGLRVNTPLEPARRTGWIGIDFDGLDARLQRLDRGSASSWTTAPAAGSESVRISTRPTKRSTRSSRRSIRHERRVFIVDHRNVGAAFRRLSLPTAVSMLGDQLLGIVDTIVIGSLGAVALAGATAANTVFARAHLRDRDSWPDPASSQRSASARTTGRLRAHDTRGRTGSARDESDLRRAEHSARRYTLSAR